jgi:hypothetical protein
MPIGLALRCREDIDVITHEGQEFSFQKGRIYLGIPYPGKFYVVDTKHRPLPLPLEVYGRHFEQLF